MLKTRQIKATSVLLISQKQKTENVNEYCQEAFIQHFLNWNTIANSSPTFCKR